MLNSGSLMGKVRDSMRMIWRASILAGLLLVFSGECLAGGKRVIVFEGPYELIEEEDLEGVEYSAKLIMEKAISAAEKAGWKITTPTEEDRKCNDKECLKQAIQKYGVNESIYISTSQFGARYEFEVVLGSGKNLTSTKTGTLSDALQEAEKLAVMALREDPASEEPVEEPTPEQAPENEDEVKNKPVSRPVFWSSLAATGVLIIGGAAVEGVAYSKLKDYSDKPQLERSKEERKKVENWRLASRIVICTAMAGVITTTVLGFLTDFSEKDSGQKVSFVPTFTGEGGALLLQGSF